MVELFHVIGAFDSGLNAQIFALGVLASFNLQKMSFDVLSISLMDNQEGSIPWTLEGRAS